MNGSLKKGTVTKEDLLEMKFTLLILYTGVTTPEQREEIDQGLRSILTPEQYQSAIIGSLSTEESDPDQK